LSLLISFIAAIFPILIYSYILWKLDKYDREPFLFVSAHFLWGAVGAILLGIIGNLFLSLLSGQLDSNSESTNFLQSVIFAPICEEIAKGIFLIISVNSKKFDNITDGLLYGGTIGLGFGMTENFMYFAAYSTSITDWIYIVIIRSLFSAVMHCIATGTLGAFLALSKFTNHKVKKVYPLVGLLLAMMIHFTWNISVSFEKTYLWGLLFMIALISFFILIFLLSVSNERKIIESELLEEINLGLIPQDYVNILSSFSRLKIGWISEDVRKEYTRYAVRLAFTKNLFKNSSGYKKIFYESEIEKYRTAIKLLKSNYQLENK
jgi:RsiW-degrading membrane proteinase PrsW (M82 family)